nr:hybrid signal transduction histidine kinase M [Tanacetum cinerariifolium]
MVIEDNPPPPPPTPIDKIIPFRITNKAVLSSNLLWKLTPPLQISNGVNLRISSRCGSSDPYAVLSSNLLWKLTPPLQISNGVNLMISSRCGSSDPYDARAINLYNELRSIKIGKMTVNEYCSTIQAMANRLKNLDCEVSKKNMVIFAVNGRDSRFTTLAEIVRHSEPIPTFEMIRNMLLLKESSFSDNPTSTTFESISSSPTIFMASSSSNTKVPPLGTNVSVTPGTKCFILLLLVLLFLVIRRNLHMFAMLVSLGTLELGLHLYASATTSLVGYTDVDWAGCPSTRSAEAEYQGVANVVAETAWLHNLLHELHSPFLTATLVYCDSVSAVYMSANPYADIFTKDIPSALFEDFRSRLSVRPYQ